MKVTTTNYGNRTEILRFPDHYVNVAVMVSDTGVTPDENGKKIVKAGTIVGGEVSAFLKDPTQKVTEKNTQGSTASSAEGVLFSDVDVTHGAAPGTMLIHGFIDQNKIPTAPAAEAEAALAGRILFIK